MLDLFSPQQSQILEPSCMLPFLASERRELKHRVTQAEFYFVDIFVLFEAFSSCYNFSTQTTVDF